MQRLGDSFCCTCQTLGQEGQHRCMTVSVRLSASCTPVRKIAETRKQSAATGILYSLALGYPSCIIPAIC